MLDFWHITCSTYYCQSLAPSTIVETKWERHKSQKSSSLGAARVKPPTHTFYYAFWKLDYGALISVSLCVDRKLMSWNRWVNKNFFSIWVAALLLFVLTLTSSIFYFTNFYIFPAQQETEASQLCLNQLESSAYQIKQMVLENINDSKLWVESKRNSLFDSRWLGISYYEYSGSEWILKDSKLNPTVSQLYKITFSDFVKKEQSLVFPHPLSEQIQLQEAFIQNIPIITIDAPNSNITTAKKHLVRISLFSDTLATALNTNERCLLSLFDTRGNSLIQKQDYQDGFFLSELQSSYESKSFAEIISISNGGHSLFAKKIFKNLYILSEVNSSKIFAGWIHVEILLVSFLLSFLATLILAQVPQSIFHERIRYIIERLRHLSSNQPAPFLKTHGPDELTPIEEEVSLLSEEKRRHKK